MANKKLWFKLTKLIEKNAQFANGETRTGKQLGIPTKVWKGENTLDWQVITLWDKIALDPMRGLEEEDFDITPLDGQPAGEPKKEVPLPQGKPLKFTAETLPIAREILAKALKCSIPDLDVKVKEYNKTMNNALNEGAILVILAKNAGQDPAALFVEPPIQLPPPSPKPAPIKAPAKPVVKLTPKPAQKSISSKKNTALANTTAMNNLAKVDLPKNKLEALRMVWEQRYRAQNLEFGEFIAFAEYCRVKKLNFMANECYPIKYFNNKSGEYQISYITSVGKIQANTERSGKLGGPIVVEFSMDTLNWTKYWTQPGAPKYGRARVKRRDLDGQEDEIFKLFSECAKNTSFWRDSPLNMFTKTLISALCRKISPEEVGEVYEASEFGLEISKNGVEFGIIESSEPLPQLPEETKEQPLVPIQPSKEEREQDEQDAKEIIEPDPEDPVIFNVSTRSSYWDWWVRKYFLSDTKYPELVNNESLPRALAFFENSLITGFHDGLATDIVKATIRSHYPTLASDLQTVLEGICEMENISGIPADKIPLEIENLLLAKGTVTK